MWIRIETADGPNLKIPVPLLLAGNPAVIKLWTKFGGEQAAQFAPIAKDLVRELRRYKNKHGHFVLLEVEDSEGDHVLITV